MLVNDVENSAIFCAYAHWKRGGIIENKKQIKIS